jgi:hypothetical protein
MLGVGLQEGPGEEPLDGIEIRPALHAFPPEFVQQLLPARSSRVAQCRGGLCERGRCDLLDEAQELGEPGEEREDLEFVAQRARRPGFFHRAGRQTLVERLLKTGEGRVETQTLGGERIGRGELIRPLDAQIPLAWPHSLPADSRATRSYQALWNLRAHVRETSPRMIDPKAPRSTAVPM